jgi:hypothetical protein
MIQLHAALANRHLRHRLATDTAAVLIAHFRLGDTIPYDALTVALVPIMDCSLGVHVLHRIETSTALPLKVPSQYTGMASVFM